MRLFSKTSSVNPIFFLPFWQKLIFTLLYGKFEKRLYVGTFWARTSLSGTFFLLQETFFNEEEFPRYFIKRLVRRLLVGFCFHDNCWVGNNAPTE